MDSLIVIDWLSITGRFSSFNEMFDFLGISDSYIVGKFLPCPGRTFFDSGLCYRSDNKRAITFLLGQSRNKAVEGHELIGMIDLSGRGCRLFESYSKLDFTSLFERIDSSDNFTVSRIDIALDIRDKDYPISRFVNALENKNYICSARYVSLTKSEQNGIAGTSIYFGKRGSDAQINIYDKRAERGYTERELPDGWIRIEVRLRHQTALAFMQRFINGTPIGQLYFGVLTDKLRFLTPNKTDSNKQRWKTAKWWLKIIQDNQRIHLDLPGTVYDMGRWEENFWLQCGSRLKLMQFMFPDPYKLYAEIDERNVKLNTDQQFLRDNYVPNVLWREI